MSDEQEERSAKRFEFASGLTLAILAAVTAVNDLGGGKYGDDEIMGHNERSAAFEWYQSKSIKQTVIEQQKDMLQALLDAGAISADATPTIQARTAKLDEEISRYKKEKKEILSDERKEHGPSHRQETPDQQSEARGSSHPFAIAASSVSLKCL